jgi:hypothetical protein
MKDGRDRVRAAVIREGHCPELGAERLTGHLAAAAE